MENQVNCIRTGVLQPQKPLMEINELKAEAILYHSPLEDSNACDPVAGFNSERFDARPGVYKDDETEVPTGAGLTQASESLHFTRVVPGETRFG